MPPRNRSLKKTDFEPEPAEVEEEKETKDGKDTNEEKEAKGESEIEDEQEKTKRERDKIHAELLSKPPHGSKVYISGMPPDATEEELKEFCKDAGEVVEVAVVRKKVYAIAFVSFRTMNMASKTIKELHKSEFKGNKVSCSLSLSNNIIFIGNIPSQWEESDLKNAIEQVGPGVIHVFDLMKLSRTGMGFAFVEYYNHACADYSRKEMQSKPDFKLDSNSPTVNWADPKRLKVKVVYIENLPKDVTKKQLKELFERHVVIEKAVLHPPKAGHEKRYAFIKFRARASAIKALQSTERYEHNGEVLNCQLAKPMEDKKHKTRKSSRSRYRAQTNERQAQMLDDPGASNKVPVNPDDEGEDVDLGDYEL